MHWCLGARCWNAPRDNPSAASWAVKAYHGQSESGARIGSVSRHPCAIRIRHGVCRAEPSLRDAVDASTWWRLSWTFSAQLISQCGCLGFAHCCRGSDGPGITINDKGMIPPQRKILGTYLTKIARVGAYLARKNNPPPGNVVMWRGLSRLTDIALDAALGA